MPASARMDSAAGAARAVAAIETADALAALPTWPRGRALTREALAWNLERWLTALRPDPRNYGERPLPPTRVWLVDHELANGGMLEGDDRRVNIYSWHPLVARLCAEASARNLAWMLFATYGFLNAVTGLITNEHESQFQLILGDALGGGRLRVIDPPAEVLLAR